MNIKNMVFIIALAIAGYTAQATDNSSFDQLPKLRYTGTLENLKDQGFMEYEFNNKKFLIDPSSEAIMSLQPDKTTSTYFTPEEDKYFEPLLRELHALGDQLIDAAMNNNITAVSNLLTHKHLPLFINNYGAIDSRFTALHCAAMKDHLEIVQMLHKAGANIMCVDNTGMIPYQAAIRKGNIRIAEYFITQAKIDPNHCGSFGHTPAYIAEMSGQKVMQAWLKKEHNMQPTQEEIVKLNDPETKKRILHGQRARYKGILPDKPEKPKSEPKKELTVQETAQHNAQIAKLTEELGSAGAAGAPQPKKASPKKLSAVERERQRKEEEKAKKQQAAAEAQASADRIKALKLAKQEAENILRKTTATKPAQQKPVWQETPAQKIVQAVKAQTDAPLPQVSFKPNFGTLIPNALRGTAGFPLSTQLYIRAQSIDLNEEAQTLYNDYFNELRQQVAQAEQEHSIKQQNERELYNAFIAEEHQRKKVCEMFAKFEQAKQNYMLQKI